MASFTIGDFRFDVLSHERTITNGVVIERFVIDAFYQDAPFDWHPNQAGREDYPGLPQRTNYEFVGRESVDVYAAFEGDKQLTDAEIFEHSAQKLATKLEYRLVGTKRGADFRSRFWPNLVRHARMALAAANSGKSIGEVADDEVDSSPITEPEDLLSRSLDEAVAVLTG